MAFSYVGPALLSFVQEGGAESSADVTVTLCETMPGLFELSYLHGLAAVQGATSVRVTLPDGLVVAGEVDYLGASSLTFSADRAGRA